MELSRALKLKEIASKKSLFLFGARATGKSTLLKSTFGDEALFINLLNSRLYLQLSQDPSQLEEIALASKKS
jgi:hypothetical protein